MERLSQHMEWLWQQIEHPRMFLVTTAISLIFIRQIWKWFFGDVGGFSQDVTDAARPGWYALWRGRYWEGEWAEVKLVVFLLLCVGTVGSVYKIGVKLFF